MEKAREFWKNSYFCSIDYAKIFDYANHNKLWKMFKTWEYQTTSPVSWETCMQVRKQQLELYMEQLTGSKLGKEYVRPPCHTAYLTYKQSTSCEIPRWITNWDEDWWEKYQQPQICIWSHSNGKSWRGTKESLDEDEISSVQSVNVLCAI